MLHGRGSVLSLGVMAGSWDGRAMDKGTLRPWLKVSRGVHRSSHHRICFTLLSLSSTPHSPTHMAMGTRNW